jgi:hypothetical protein
MYFVLSPPVGMSYFNEIFCVYLSRSCYFVLSPPVGMSYFNGTYITYRLEGTIQNNTIWIDKHKQISLKYNIPTGGDNTK